MPVTLDVLEEGLAEEQFFGMAKQIVELLYKVSMDEAVGAITLRKLGRWLIFSI